MLVVLGLDPATSEFSCHKSTSVDNFTAAYSEVAAWVLWMARADNYVGFADSKVVSVD